MPTPSPVPAAKVQVKATEHTVGEGQSLTGEGEDADKKGKAPAQMPPMEASASTGIELHYDKDEAVAESFCLGIFPLISTVTACPPLFGHSCATSVPSEPFMHATTTSTHMQTLCECICKTIGA